MGTHPIFESDFDCLTDYIRLESVIGLMLPTRTRKRREPGWVDAAIQVLESAKVEIDVPEILKQISLSNVKTIKGSIDERDALRRALEQNPDTFYTKTKDETKFGLVKNRQSSSSTSSSGGENAKSKKDSQKRVKANGDSDRRDQN